MDYITDYINIKEYVNYFFTKPISTDDKIKKESRLIFCCCEIIEIPRKHLNDMSYLFSEGNYFKNSFNYNYNIITNNSVNKKSNIKTYIIDIHMVCDFLFFFKNDEKQCEKYLKFLYPKYHDFSDSDNEDYHNYYVIYNLMNNYCRYIYNLLNYIYKDEDDVDSEYNGKTCCWGDVAHDKKTLKKLIELKSKHILIKLSIFKVSTENILITDIFNLIMNISLKIN